MSFTIFVNRFRDEKPAYFSAKELRRRFGPAVNGRARGASVLGFEEGKAWTTVDIPDGGVVDGFSIRNPVDYLEFWSIIAGFLKDLDCVLYWPGGGAVIGSLDLLPHLPKDFVESMGIPWVSTDPKRIRQYVWDHS